MSLAAQREFYGPGFPANGNAPRKYNFEEFLQEFYQPLYDAYETLEKERVIRRQKDWKRAKIVKTTIHHEFARVKQETLQRDGLWMATSFMGAALSGVTAFYTSPDVRPFFEVLVAIGLFGGAAALRDIVIDPRVQNKIRKYQKKELLPLVNRRAVYEEAARPLREFIAKAQLTLAIGD